MARLGRSDPITTGGTMVTQERPTFPPAPPKPPKTVQTNNVDVAMTNSSTMR